MTIELVPASDNEEVDGYRSVDGYSMKREQGLTPNGNPINQIWVLRDPDGKWIDCDRYRHDLTERHNLRIRD